MSGDDYDVMQRVWKDYNLKKEQHRLLQELLRQKLFSPGRKKKLKQTLKELKQERKKLDE